MKLNHNLARSGLIAAQYVLLTMVSALFGMASGPVQLRLGEALTVLPCFTSAAVPGLFAGCIIANLLSGGAPWDIIAGSLATLLGAIGTRFFRRRLWLALLSPVVTNSLIIPVVLAEVYGAPESLPVLFIMVAAGELASCCGLGFLLYRTLKSRAFQLFE